MSKKNRRELLVEAGRFALAGAIAPIVSSGASGASEAPAQSHDTKADEEQTEATAEKVIDALEGAYGVHRGRGRTHPQALAPLASLLRHARTAGVEPSHSARERERTRRSNLG